MSLLDRLSKQKFNAFTGGALMGMAMKDTFGRPWPWYARVVVLVAMYVGSLFVFAWKEDR